MVSKHQAGEFWASKNALQNSEIILTKKYCITLRYFYLEKFTNIWNKNMKNDIIISNK